MDYYPIFLDIRGKSCLVVGGGRVAERKVAGLLAAGARVYVAARSLTGKLKGLAEAGQIEYLGPEYRVEHLDGRVLAMVATDDESLNRRVAEEAESRGVLVNVADVPELCRFILPALVSQGPLALAVSTGGASPAAARMIREELEARFGPEWGDFLNLMALVRRKRLKEPFVPKENKDAFTRLARAGIPDLIREGRLGEVEEILREVMGEDYTLKELGFMVQSPGVEP